MRYEKFDVSFVCGFVGKFVEKLVIGKSVDFLVILYLYRKKVVWIVGFGLGWEMDESIDFSVVLRYWVRYWGFLMWIDKSWNFVGILVVLVEWFDF